MAISLSRPPAFTGILDTAVMAAHAGAAVVSAAWRSPRLVVNKRAHHDVKLAADVTSEKKILAILHAARPRDGILAEESGAHQARTSGLWIVDPLDGTVNFSHRHPHFCVSIAWAWEGVVRVGVVYDPLRNELFSAIQDRGAFLNGVPIRIASTTSVKRAMVAIGFGKVTPETTCLPDMTRLAGVVQKLRIMGSAALDIAYTACGRVDAYYESHIYFWDICAAALILEEAGGAAWMIPSATPYKVRCLASSPILIGTLAGHLRFDQAHTKPCTNLR